MSTWIIQEQSDGDVDVLLNGRGFQIGIDEDYAESLIKRSPKFSPSDKVWFEEVSGYRSQVKIK